MAHPSWSGRRYVWAAERDVALDPQREAGLPGTIGITRHREEPKRGDAEHIEEILYGVAAGHGVIEHGVLAQRVGTTPDLLSQELERVSRRAVEIGEPMWSALVVSVKTQRPLSAFYGMARKLRPEYGHGSLDDEDIWNREIQRCYESPRIAMLWLSQGWSPGSRQVPGSDTRQAPE